MNDFFDTFDKMRSSFSKPTDESKETRGDTIKCFTCGKSLTKDQQKKSDFCSNSCQKAAEGQHYGRNESKVNEDVQYCPTCKRVLSDAAIHNLVCQTCGSELDAAEVKDGYIPQISSRINEGQSPVAFHGENFGEYIKGHDLDCELVIADVDFPWGFVWNRGNDLTPEGKTKFASILNSSFDVLQNGNIVVNTPSTPEMEKLGELFVGGAAGYIADSQYRKWFITERKVNEVLGKGEPYKTPNIPKPYGGVNGPRKKSTYVAPEGEEAQAGNTKGGFKDYTGGAGPTEEQVHQNNVALNDALKKKGIQSTIIKYNDSKQVGEESFFEVVKAGGKMAGYDRWGFSTPNGLTLDQSSFEEAFNYLSGSSLAVESKVNEDDPNTETEQKPEELETPPVEEPVVQSDAVADQVTTATPKIEGQDQNVNQEGEQSASRNAEVASAEEQNRSAAGREQEDNGPVSVSPIAPEATELPIEEPAVVVAKEEVVVQPEECEEPVAEGFDSALDLGQAKARMLDKAMRMIATGSFDRTGIYLSLSDEAKKVGMGKADLLNFIDSKLPALAESKKAVKEAYSVYEVGDTIQFDSFLYTNTAGGTGIIKKGKDFFGEGFTCPVPTSGKVVKVLDDYEIGTTYHVRLDPTTISALKGEMRGNIAYVSEFDVLENGKSRRTMEAKIKEAIPEVESYKDKVKRLAREATEEYFPRTKVVPTGDEIVNYVADAIEEDTGIDIDDDSFRHIAEILGITLDESRVHEDWDGLKGGIVQKSPYKTAQVSDFRSLFEALPNEYNPKVIDPKSPFYIGPSTGSAVDANGLQLTRGDKVKAIRTVIYTGGQDRQTDKISREQVVTVERIPEDGRLQFSEVPDRYGPFESDDFVRVPSPGSDALGEATLVDQPIIGQNDQVYRRSSPYSTGQSDERGTVLRIIGNMAAVRWNSGKTTQLPVSELIKESKVNETVAIYATPEEAKKEIATWIQSGVARDAKSFRVRKLQLAISQDGPTVGMRSFTDGWEPKDGDYAYLPDTDVHPAEEFELVSKIVETISSESAPIKIDESLGKVLDQNDQEVGKITIYDDGMFVAIMRDEHDVEAPTLEGVEQELAKKGFKVVMESKVNEDLKTADDIVKYVQDHATYTGNVYAVRYPPTSSKALIADDTRKLVVLLGRKLGIKVSESKKDKFGREWNLPKKELCPKCGQPDSCGDCNHKKLSNDEVNRLKEVKVTETELPPKPTINYAGKELKFLKRIPEEAWEKGDNRYNHPYVVLHPGDIGGPFHDVYESKVNEAEPFNGVSGLQPTNSDNIVKPESPAEPVQPKKEDEKGEASEGGKIYLGKKGTDEFVYLVVVPNNEEGVSEQPETSSASESKVNNLMTKFGLKEGNANLQILDAAGKVVMDAKEMGEDTEDVKGFILKAIDQLDLTELSTTMVLDQLIPPEEEAEPEPEATKTPEPEENQAGEPTEDLAKQPNESKINEGQVAAGFYELANKIGSLISTDQVRLRQELQMSGVLDKWRSKMVELRRALDLAEEIAREVASKADRTDESVTDLLEKFGLNEAPVDLTIEAIRASGEVIKIMKQAGVKGSEEIKKFIGLVVKELDSLIGLDREIMRGIGEAQVDNLLEKFGLKETSVSPGPERCRKCKARIGTAVSDNFNGLCPECWEEAQEADRTDESVTDLLEKFGLNEAPNDAVMTPAKEEPKIKEDPRDQDLTGKEVKPEEPGTPPVSAEELGPEPTEIPGAAEPIPAPEGPAAPIAGEDYSSPEAAKATIEQTYPEEPLRSTALAYADSVIEDPKIYGAVRNMSWNGLYTNGDMFQKQAAVVGEYGTFSKAAAKALVDRFGNSAKYKLAREVRPVVYLTLRDVGRDVEPVSVSEIKGLVSAKSVDLTGEPGEVKISF